MTPTDTDKFADQMIKELREKVFEGQKIRTLQPTPDGTGPAVVEW